jgi:PAS domain S-box-containing protein
MFGNYPNLGFPRKVVACYLLFCMAAVCWLSLGVLWTSHHILSSQSADSCLSRLGKTAAAIELSHLRHGTDELNHLLQRAQAEGGLNYASIVGVDGNYVAHADESKIGTRAEPTSGSLLRWGSVSGIRFADQQGQTLQEYQVPLIVNSAPIGTLRIAVMEPSFEVTLAKVAQYAPVAVLIPLALVVLGALVLSRLTRTVADFESQLRTVALLPSGAEVSLKSLKPRNGATLGWNRVVETIEKMRSRSGNASLNERLAEAIASRRQKELIDILQNLNDGVAVTDPEGRITFANRAIETLLGAESSELSQEESSFSDCLVQSMPELAQCSLFDPEWSNRPAVSEGRRRGAKSDRVLRVSRQPLVAERLKGHVWSLRDVTQQKLADKMRDQFIDTATHELRTPLSNIKAYAEMLATCDRIELEQQKEFCNIINSEVTRLARFVDDLLSISSMEVGSLSAERQKVETARLFDEVLAKVQPLMQKKEIQFEVRLPEKMHDLSLDKEKMVAVLVNLLGNAAKYTPQGGHVSLKVKLDEKLLQIGVEDTGVGISAEELPLVFEKFFRSNDSRVQAETGTGLGLSLAREVVRMHGGDITVESQLNKGSTFTVSIPLE